MTQFPTIVVMDLGSIFFVVDGTGNLDLYTRNTGYNLGKEKVN